ncbi:MAG: L,D-transpeptidase family protein [Aquidulcibacter sp.]|jgi:murein L,D-transpeptidase YcbB/YkuD|uniref:L,D-transpeptidase family protein n=1 Tax=Aquidulcibacter sp. TaxID=2052990 RepID=UPI0022CD0C54|nr:L,D-transpeptidase family protein [Aquidulcibacter sp.]
MKKQLMPFVAFCLCSAAAAPDPNSMVWTPTTLGQLAAWIDAAPKEGLCLSDDPSFGHALAADNSVLVNQIATSQALKLGRLHLLGCATPAQRRGWNIATNDAQIDMEALLATALAQGDVNPFFRALRPKTPDYEALRLAYGIETNPRQRTILARNMDRWRWLPLNLGARYLLVNIPGFEVSLRENEQIVERWRVIVGKPTTPTPIFEAEVTGVTVNPWWNVPQSIVTESVGRLVRINPQEARRRGYVWSNGSYRQRPGSTNSLGRIKLAMPNHYDVYLHDTPNKALFNMQVRAFSHGCMRVGNALGFASRLLGRPVDRLVESGLTATLPLPAPIPVYVTYFTADMSEGDVIEYHPDIYGRDKRMGDSFNPGMDCPG